MSASTSWRKFEFLCAARSRLVTETNKGKRMRTFSQALAVGGVIFTSNRTIICLTAGRVKGDFYGNHFYASPRAAL
jgi:hypothetical protein